MSTQSSNPPNGSGSLQRLEHAWRSLQYRDFKLLFFGQAISLVGSWMTRVATSWLIYRLTHSAVMLGVAGFASAITMFLFAPIAGVWADGTRNRRYWIILTQVVLLLTSLTLSVLVLTHRINVATVLVISVIKGLAQAFDMPLRQSLTADVIKDREDLANAIALNSSAINIARLLGPSFAGFILAISNEGYCFLVDAISYVAVVVSLVIMRPVEAPAVAAVDRVPMMLQLREGWSYVWGQVVFRYIIVLFATISLMGIPYTVLMPIFTTKVLHGGPQILGILLGAPGVGALVSAVMLATRKSTDGLIDWIPRAAAVFGVSLIVFSQSRHIWLSAVVLLFVGFGMMQTMSVCSTVLQTATDDAMRGRVMSYYIMAMTGVLPFGNLLAGWLAQHMGAPFTVLINGVCVVLVAGVFWAQRHTLRREIGPLYARVNYHLPAEDLIDQVTRQEEISA